MYIQGWHMPCGKEDMMPFMLKNWIGKDGLIQISFYLPFSKIAQADRQIGNSRREANKS
jgi:hypothetical protein